MEGGQAWDGRRNDGPPGRNGTRCVGCCVRIELYSEQSKGPGLETRRSGYEQGRLRKHLPDNKRPFPMTKFSFKGRALMFLSVLFVGALIFTSFGGVVPVQAAAP